jgi:hypothetical protein
MTYLLLIGWVVLIFLSYRISVSLLEKAGKL